MAKKTIFGVGLLHDGRAVRVGKITSKLMIELTRRVGRRLQPDKNSPEPTRSDIQCAMEEEMIALLVKGITLRPVELKMRKRALTDAERAEYEKQKQAPPAERDEVDLDATLLPYTDKESPEFGRWTALGEQQLANADEENELSMFALFEAPQAWIDVLAAINAHSGGAGANPFAGRLVKTSSS